MGDDAGLVLMVGLIAVVFAAAEVTAAATAGVLHTVRATHADPREFGRHRSPKHVVPQRSLYSSACTEEFATLLFFVRVTMIDALLFSFAAVVPPRNRPPSGAQGLVRS